MRDEKTRYEPQASLPIPTYEEATSSRPQSSQSFLGPAEVSHDAERQGLLGRRDPPTRPDGYRPPTVESARSSIDEDFLPSSSDSSARNSEEGLRREIQEMEVDDEATRSQMSTRLSKRISSITSNFARKLPFRKYLPSLGHIRERMPTLPEWLKPGWIFVVRVFALLLVLAFAYIVFFTGIFQVRQRGRSYDPDSVRKYVQEHINETWIMDSARHATKYDHVAGTKGSFFMADWIKNVMNDNYLDSVKVEQFDVYLNYPKKDGRKVAIIDPPDKRWEAKLEENKVYKDEDQTLVFHGLSKSGNVTGPLIYANYGSRDDFKKLEDQGISLKGAIALVRYYGTQEDRSLKVKAAELAGAVGCIIYSDPKEDGFVLGKPYPDGRFMPEDGVQRGTVGLTSWIVGDVLSPGFASTPTETKRISKDNNPALNKIPSIPIAWGDAKHLLQALKGHGKKLNDDKWQGGVPEVEWWTGDQNSPKVHLKNEQDEVERRPIYNVWGTIQGIEQAEKSVIVGNHYDSWCYGAVDPGSGTAVFLEMVRIFGDLKRLGWRPLRTIEFIAWDAEEYNLIGSTEHVEARIDDLRRNGVAYVNVDVAVDGYDFSASGSPMLEKALRRCLNRVADPKRMKSLNTVWNERKQTMKGLGAGSDYVAFQDLAGVSSIDLTFGGLQHPYHSCYDNFDWMIKYGDPSFEYHATLAEVQALLILELADRPIIPFELEDYAKAVKGYVQSLEKFAKDKGGPDKSLNLKPLYDSVDLMARNARSFHEFGDKWDETTSNFESQIMAFQRANYNNKLSDFETNLLDIDGGLPGREQYKHVLYAPQLWNAYDEAFIPGPRDAIEKGDWKAAQEQVEKVARIIKRASEKLLE